MFSDHMTQTQNNDKDYKGVNLLVMHCMVRILDDKVTKECKNIEHKAWTDSDYRKS